MKKAGTDLSVNQIARNIYNQVLSFSKASETKVNACANTQHILNFYP